MNNLLQNVLKPDLKMQNLLFLSIKNMTTKEYNDKIEDIIFNEYKNPIPALFLFPDEIKNYYKCKNPLHKKKYDYYKEDIQNELIKSKQRFNFLYFKIKNDNIHKRRKKSIYCTLCNKFIIKNLSYKHDLKHIIKTINVKEIK
jgi:hypothetical protein